MKKLLNKVLPVLAIAMLFLVGMTAYAAEEDVQKLTIVHTNDTHGRVDVYAYGKGLVDQIENDGGTAVFIDNGDVVNGTSFGMNNDGANVMEVMNKAGVNMMNLGNHEQFLSVEKFGALSQAANFPFTGANIDDAFRNAGDVQDYWIYELKGTRIAFIGLTTGSHTDANGDAAVARANAAMEAAKSQGATVFIGAFHLGITDTDLSLRSTYIAERCPWLSIIIDGHCHTPYQKKVNGVYMVETGEYGNNLGRIDLSLKNGVVDHIESSNIPISANNGITPDADVQNYIAEIVEQLTYLEETVFTLPVALDGERTTVRAKECVFGNLATDAMMTASDADMAVIPGVFLRASVPAGAVSRATFQTMFLNKATPIYEIEITGQDLWNFMEAALAGVPEVSGNFRHIGGAVIAYDEKQEAGSRIVSFLIGGKDLDQKATYTLAGTSMDMNTIFGENWAADSSILEGTHYKIAATDINTAFAAYINSGNAAWEIDGRLGTVKDSDKPDPEPETKEPETKEPETKESETKESAPKKGTVFSAGKYTYKITNAKTDGNGTVTITGIVKGKTVKKVNIPATAAYKGYTYKVTAIAKKAFYKNKKITSAVIGKNVKTIGSGAFRSCKNLKKVVIKSKKLTSVGKHSFKGTKKVTIKVPAKKYKQYKKLFAKQKNKKIKVTK